MPFHAMRTHTAYPMRSFLVEPSSLFFAGLPWSCSIPRAETTGVPGRRSLPDLNDFPWNAELVLGVEIHLLNATTVGAERRVLVANILS